MSVRAMISQRVKPLLKPLLSGLAPVLAIFRNFRSSGNLRVLIYHDVAPQDVEQIERQLQLLSERYEILSPEAFRDVMEGRKACHGTQILVTFDDGFKSNRLIAEKVLARLGIRAIFFVVPEFVDMAQASKDQQKKFISHNLFEGARGESEIPDHEEPMSWEDLKFLKAQGHVIGSHTLSHKRLSDITNLDHFQQELSDASRRIEKELGEPADMMAYPFGDIASISSQALAMACASYRYVFSGVRGRNIPAETSLLGILRDSIDVKDQPSFVCYIVEGGLSFWYRKARCQLAEYVRLAGNQARL